MRPDSDFYLCTIGAVAGVSVGGAGEIASVSHSAARLSAIRAGASAVNSADIQVKRPSELRQAQLNAGIGGGDELAAIAEGELKQMDVLGIETAVRPRQFELALDRIFGFADSQPDVIAAALVNAHKFVPNA